MKLIIIPFLFSIIHQQSLKINFGLDNTGADWYVVNDGVMGGLSKSQLYISEH